ncbi:MAG: helix-turn-helix domain-containing protein [Gammaproteobacteria bacterium]|nr:helix-turn-helix domain-containing protein [Gammaproteobacteria bacterium]
MKPEKIKSYREELKKAVAIFGSQRQFAEEINTYISLKKLNAKKVCQQTISNWIHRDKKIARDYPPVIEAITNRVVRASTLRGDGKTKS